MSDLLDKLNHSKVKTSPSFRKIITIASIAATAYFGTSCQTERQELEELYNNNPTYVSGEIRVEDRTEPNSIPSYAHRFLIIEGNEPYIFNSSGEDAQKIDEAYGLNNKVTIKLNYQQSQDFEKGIKEFSINYRQISKE